MVVSGLLIHWRSSTGCLEEAPTHTRMERRWERPLLLPLGVGARRTVKREQVSVLLVLDLLLIAWACCATTRGDRMLSWAASRLMKGVVFAGCLGLKSQG